MAAQVIAERKKTGSSYPLIEEEATLREKAALIPNWELQQSETGVWKLSRTFTGGSEL
jgi:hypothetical protein